MRCSDDAPDFYTWVHKFRHDCAGWDLIQGMIADAVDACPLWYADGVDSLDLLRLIFVSENPCMYQLQVVKKPTQLSREHT